MRLKAQDKALSRYKQQQNPGLQYVLYPERSRELTFHSALFKQQRLTLENKVWQEGIHPFKPGVLL